jgi:hypothetical protein
MGQPVKLSDALVADARATGQVVERSIAGQIEFWARLGRSAELLLNGAEATALKQTGDAVPLSELLATVNSSTGRKRLQEHLAARPFPHFEPAPGPPGLLVRLEADGTRTVGRFAGREFRPAATPRKKAAQAREKPAKRPRHKNR